MTDQLWWACEQGDVKKLRRLLRSKHKAINRPLKQFSGATPLHIAARFGQAAMVDLLVSHGADPSARDDRGQTPLDKARAFGLEEVVHRLQSAPTASRQRPTADVSMPIAAFSQPDIAASRSGFMSVIAAIRSSVRHAATGRAATRIGSSSGTNWSCPSIPPWTFGACSLSWSCTNRMSAASSRPLTFSALADASRRGRRSAQSATKSAPVSLLRSPSATSSTFPSPSASSREVSLKVASVTKTSAADHWYRYTATRYPWRERY